MLIRRWNQDGLHLYQLRKLTTSMTITHARSEAILTVNTFTIAYTYDSWNPSGRTTNKDSSSITIQIQDQREMTGMKLRRQLTLCSGTRPETLSTNTAAMDIHHPIAKGFMQMI